MTESIFLPQEPLAEWPVRDLIDHRYALKLLEPSHKSPLYTEWLLAVGHLAFLIKEKSFSKEVLNAVAATYE